MKPIILGTATSITLPRS